MPRNRTETAYSPRSTTPAQRAEQAKQRRAADLNELLTEIARKHLPVETLETQNRDCLCSVAAIKRALEAAYEAGRKSR